LQVEKLSATAIAQRIIDLPDWTLEQHKLFRRFVFANFVEAFAFMSQVAQLAENLGHHPDWSNVYNRVEIHLTTHDVGGLSALDFTLAKQIDSLL